MKYFILMIYFLSNFCIAQNAFFIDKKGKKTFMRDDSVEIIVLDKRISYAEPGKQWEKYLKFSDLNYAVVGDYLFKSFILINENGKHLSDSAYFVVHETESKKLLIYTYDVIAKYGRSSHSFVYIIDNQNNILDSVLDVTEATSHLKKRMKVVEIIQKNFADSPTLLNSLNISKEDEGYFGILNFISKPKLIK